MKSDKPLKGRCYRVTFLYKDSSGNMRSIEMAAWCNEVTDISASFTLYDQVVFHGTDARNGRPWRYPMYHSVNLEDFPVQNEENDDLIECITYKLIGKVESRKYDLNYQNNKLIGDALRRKKSRSTKVLR